MDDFEGALNEEADASPADGMEEIDETATADQLASDPADETHPALNEGAGGDEDQKGPIPYERFADVNGKYQDLNKWSPVLERLRAQGFDSPEAVTNALERQAQELEEARLLAHYQAQVDRAEIDPATANQRMQLDIQRRSLERDREQLAEWRLGQDVANAKTTYPEADAEYVTAMAKATGQPVATLAKASHEKAIAYRERVIADYNQAKAAPKPPPEGGGGKTPPGKTGVPEINDPNFDKWYEQELRKTLQTYR